MNRLAVTGLLLLTSVSVAANAQEAGKATSVSGVVSVQHRDGSVGVLAKGTPVRSGDTLQSQQLSYARVLLTDGADLALRPGSTLKIEAYGFDQSKPEADSLVMRLLKGGLRTITGLVGKRRVDSFQMNAGVATIGVRGTDFVARVCDDACKREADAGANVRVPPVPGYIGRVVSVQGRLSAVSGPRSGRQLANGDLIYVNDVVETSADGLAVIVYQDGTRAVLRASTRLGMQSYRYEPSNPDSGNAAFNLVRGGLRILTGLIAQRTPARFTVGTTVATIGVRGTGFDISCTGACAEAATPGDGGNCAPGTDGSATATCTQAAPSNDKDGPPAGLVVYNWKGKVYVKNDGGEFELLENQVSVVAGKDIAPRRLDAVPPFFLREPETRPDKLDIELSALFGKQADDFSEPGVYVYVRDGVVTMNGPGGNYSLNRGETGFIDRTGQRFERLSVVPTFIDRDGYTRHMDFEGYGCSAK